jgi:hypothetical protein
MVKISILDITTFIMDIFDSAVPRSGMQVVARRSNLSVISVPGGGADSI